MELLHNKEIDKLSISEKKEYYENLKKKCLLLKDKQKDFGQKLIYKVYPNFRNYSIEIQGEENIIKDSCALFVINHSNSHDIFTAYEFLTMLNRKASVMVATDCLNLVTTSLFNISNATLLDRRKEEDRKASVFKMSKKILNGYDGVIFGESTWNLHPTLLMHNIKTGPVNICNIADVPIIPTVFEYIENDGVCESEDKLYKKCIIRFSKPIVSNLNNGIIDQTNDIKNNMIKLRKEIWKDYNIDRNKIDEVNPKIYVNHTYLKKFGGFGFNYNTELEFPNLYFRDDEKKENEYIIDEDGSFKPGVLKKIKK